MTAQEQVDSIFSGKYEIELTEKLIKELVSNNLWGDEDSLRAFRQDGAKWNTKRNSIVYPAKFI
jgi:uncharacterized protein (DUF4415 family)